MTPKPMTLTQKILASHAIGLTRPWVEPGDILQVRVDWTIASELAWNGMDRTYTALGRPGVHDKDRFFLAVDHTVDPVTLATDKRAQKLTQLSREFAKEAGITHFYDANVTILHTKFYRDLVQPGEIVLGADSHTSSHGGMGAFAIGLGGADITAAMVLGTSWIEVPDAIEVVYAGEPAFGIGGKDIILRTLGDLGRNTVAMERTVEYRGDAVRKFTTDTRFTIANMTAEFGGLNGIFEPDAQVAAWLSRRKSHNAGALWFRSDEGAPYVARYPIDLSRIEPLVAKPFSPDNVATAREHAGTALQGAFIGACTTTEEELVLSALVLEQVLKDQAPVASEKRIVVPGDLTIQRRLQERGLWAIYEKAGFRVSVPGCSMCLGVASEKAGKGETWLSSQNRNFPNRMGEGSLAWLASGPTVAASAVSMKIADPRPYLAKIDRARYAALLQRDGAGAAIEVRASDLKLDVVPAHAAATGGAPDQPWSVRGQVQVFPDNIDTDAIIPGEFCHLTKLEELGEKCFHFVRPGFAAVVRAGGTVIVAGEGWGSGSSREQAVWALQGAGIRLVIAKSYAFIHKRNLVNEALPFLVVKDPAFHAAAVEGVELEANINTGEIRLTATGKVFHAERLTPIVRSMLRERGLVPAIQRHGARVFERLAAGK
ncbi:MAG: 3-isopropylmalate dehydratase [Candidatus Brocadiae bacterium]|nr:3-isopropylmalate dehydratase [Candidatus Brocadiia bacterium]